MSETKQTQGREEEADAALRNTQFSRGTMWFLVGFFVLTIASVPLIQLFYGAPPDASLDAIPTGEQLKKLEKSVETSSVAMAGVRPKTQEVLTTTFRAGNEQVVIGSGGWLFYRQGIDALAGEGFLEPRALKARLKNTYSVPDPIAGILDLKAQLSRRGIALIIMPVPDKATIYPEKLWPSRADGEAPPQNHSFDAFKRALDAKGVLVYDATDTMWKGKTHLKKAQYFPLDTHWTPIAIDLCANDLATMIEKYVPLPPRVPVNYIRRPIHAVDPGDLLRLLGLPKNQKKFHPTSVAPQAVKKPNGPILAPERSADVLVLGDSFSGAYTEVGAGLPQQLAFYLGRPVDQLGVANGGSLGARSKLRDLMKKGDDRLAGKKLVIYEFVARDLAFGNWKPIELKPAHKNAT